MSIILIRSLILYIIVIFAVRLMGKRQLGELQPSELVITILVSNIATLPLEDTSIPLIVGITPILALVCYEVIMSWLSLKFPKIRKLISGRPKIIIKDGIIDRKVLQDLRFSVDDLMTALRGDDIFDISQVQYAIVETTGNISAVKKAEEENLTRKDAGLFPQSYDPPQIVISDGRLMENTLKAVPLSEKELKRILRKEKFDISEIFIMTADSSGKYYIADKKGSKPVSGERSKSDDKG